MPNARCSVCGDQVETYGDIDPTQRDQESVCYCPNCRPSNRPNSLCRRILLVTICVLLSTGGKFFLSEPIKLSALGARIDEDANGNVVSIVLSGKNVDDNDLKLLADFNHLKSLTLRRTALTDSGLRHLQTLDSLEYLELGETEITGTGLVHLGTAGKTRLPLYAQGPLVFHDFLDFS